MATSDSSVHSFMEMAAGLLLADRVDIGVRNELVQIAARNGLEEAEMDEVVRQLAEQGIVSLDASFTPSDVHESESQKSVEPSPNDDQRAQPSSDSTHQPSELTVAPPAELKLPIDTASDVDVELIAKDPLARDMFKQRVAAKLRNNREVTREECVQLLEEACGFGVHQEAATPMLRRWLIYANVDNVDALLGTHDDVKGEAQEQIPVHVASETVKAPPPIPPPLPSHQGLDSEPIAPPIAPPIGRPVSTPTPPSGPPPQEITFVGEEPESKEGIEFVEAATSDVSESSALHPDAAPGEGAPAPLTPMAPPVSAPSAQSPEKEKNQRTPGESYIRYLEKAIPKLGREHISVRSEERLIAQGAEKLGIGAPYALELLRQVAADLGVPMLSQQSIDEDPRFDSFRERAASILAEHRGVNVKSRMLLSAIGQELGLGEEELDQAMLQLSGDADTELEDAKQASFRSRLKETLRSMRDSFITSPIESAILDDGVDYEGLNHETARQILHDEAGEAGVVVIDKRHAQRHILGLLSQNSAQGEPVDLAPLLEEARLWGLSDDEFMEVVASQRAEKAKQQRRERRITAIALGGSCVTAAAMLWGAIWLMWPRQPADEPVVVAPPPVEPAAQPAPASASVEEPNPWNDPELLIGLTNARKATPLDRQQIVQGVVSEDPQRRQLSMNSLIGDLRAAKDDRIRRDALIQLFKHWFRIETSEDNAQQLMLELLAMLPNPGDQLPEKVEAYEQDFQLMVDIVEIMSQETLSPERREWVGEQLAEKLETVVDFSRGWTDIERHCKAELAVLLYRNLITSVKLTDGPFEPHHWALSVHLVSLVRPVDPARAEKLQLDFLDRNMRSGKESWTPYEELIRRFAYSKDAVTVLRMTKLMEETTNESLQRLLSNLLLLNIGEVSRNQPVAEVAAMVRSHFQGASKPKSSERTQEFIKAAQERLSRYSPAVGTDAISQQIIEFARLNTMGAGAHAGARGSDSFDALKVREPRLGVSTAPAAAPAARVAWQRGLNDNMTRQIQTLNREKRVPQRVLIFQSICNTALAGRRHAGRVPTYEPEPKYARIIADYLVQPKTSTEHDKLLVTSAHLANWPNVLLALVDELETFDSREPTVEEIVRTLVPSLSVGPGDPWKTTLQRALLRVALDNLETSSPSGGRSTVTLAGTHLSTYYNTQATLRAISEEQLAAADGPGKTLQLMVRNLHQELLAADIKSPEDKQWVEQLEHLLVATNNAAPNDIQRLAMFQRLWLRLLRIELSLATPTAAPQALLIEQDLEPLDRKAATVWEQLRDGEVQLLRLWLLYNQEAGQ